MKKRSAVIAVVLALAVLGLWLKSRGAPVFPPEQQALIDAAKANGAAGVHARKMDDGGLLLGGKLEGLDFIVAVPWRWNHQAVLVAYGYRPPGFPTIIPDNPLADDGVGFHRLPYQQGFLTGRAEYAKAGLGVQTGVESTYRLKQLTDKLGATRSYIMGASMGGNITMALIEKHPQDFAGAISWCGAVGGWPGQLGLSIDIRAAYNWFTRGTKYEMPGDHSLLVSGIGMPPEGLPKWLALPLAFVPMKRMMSPVMELFSAAEKHPGGPESRIIDNIVAVTGAVRDPAAIMQPMSAVVLGTDDLNQVFGGSIYDNSAKVYSSPLLTAQENAEMNAGIGRIKSDPAALARAAQWYQPTGRFPAKLMTVYNLIDPMVPYQRHETVLRAAVERAGNLDHLVQRAAPSTRDKLAGTQMEGYVHCGFTADQVSGAWSDLRAWVETDKKPAEVLP